MAHSMQMAIFAVHPGNLGLLSILQIKYFHFLEIE